jgi:hypothetical protein
MTYRKAMTLVIVAFVGISTFDIWWVVSGNFGKDSYLPGIYPVACVVAMIGLRITKKFGLWDSPLK